MWLPGALVGSQRPWLAPKSLGLLAPMDLGRLLCALVGSHGLWSAPSSATALPHYWKEWKTTISWEPLSKKSSLLCSNYLLQRSVLFIVRRSACLDRIKNNTVVASGVISEGLQWRLMLTAAAHPLSHFCFSIFILFLFFTVSVVPLNTFPFHLGSFY